MDPVTLYALADDVLSYVKAFHESVLPPAFHFERSHVVNGPAPLDGVTDCVEHLVVWAEMILPTTAFPAPAGGVLTCGDMARMVQLTVQTLRCEPTLDGRGFPAPAERDAAARLAYVDAWTVWNALSGWAIERNARDGDGALLMSAQPVPPSRVAGWETRILAEVDSCHYGPPHVPFPTGFFDGLS